MNTQMLPVQSSNIKAIGYDESTQTLVVEFLSKLNKKKKGPKYKYLNVPSNIHQALMDAKSHGSYLAIHIKPNYTAEKITE